MRKRLLLSVCGVLLAVAGCGGGTKAGGHRILFVQRHGDHSPIYLWRTGSSAVRIGPADASVDSIEWSPDGKSIAFSGQISPAGWDQGIPNHVYEMRANGTGVKQLTDDPGINRDVFGEQGPSWAPDGGKVLYSRNTASSSNPLVLVNVRTGKEQELGLSGSELHVSWGRPGIAYVAGSDDGTIMLFDPEMDRSRVFALTHGTVEALAWSRSGRLAVIEGTLRHNWLIVYSRNGRELERLRLKAPVPNACGITWSPEGERLLVVGTSVVSGAARFGVWTIGLSGGRWRKLPLRSVGGCAVSWR